MIDRYHFENMKLITRVFRLRQKFNFLYKFGYYWLFSLVFPSSTINLANVCNIFIRFKVLGKVKLLTCRCTSFEQYNFLKVFGFWMYYISDFYKSLCDTICNEVYPKLLLSYIYIQSYRHLGMNASSMKKKMNSKWRREAWNCLQNSCHTMPFDVKR